MSRKSVPGSAYPPNWNEIAQAVKDAARWKCVRCGRAHDPSVGRMLGVHHLDMNPSNCAWWNIPALCQVCHLIIQHKVVMERGWMFEHSTWFQPYVAAYYGARAGLLPETTHYFDSLLLVRRAFVETHLEYLLSLGKPQGIGSDMDTGMLWFDNSPSALSVKIQRAVDYYQKKYGRTPDLCLVHPSMLEANQGPLEVKKLAVRPYRPVLPGHIWVGIEDKQ